MSDVPGPSKCFSTDNFFISVAKKRRKINQDSSLDERDSSSKEAAYSQRNDEDQSDTSEAAKRERDAAIAEGRISKEGIPIIDVYADACWSSRSYGNNYRALSGAAAIVGRRFESLLEDVDTNVVERFNSVVAKIVGGKRINFSLRRGYRARCSAAVLSFNNPHPRHTLHKKILGQSPKSILKKIEIQRLKKREKNKTKPHKKNRTLRKEGIVQHDYGAMSTTPDMTKNELNIAKELFLLNLKQLTSDKEKIQQSTSNQRNSNDWIELRKNMITASNFGTVVKRRETSSKAKLVQNILYKSNLRNIAAIAHGVENEELALQQLAMQEKVTIEPCGLFVDNEYPFCWRHA
ncbi:hypothetical protein EVAR_87376_1 [Eumeta japonica]|uniref:Mutator-like transposase domain-containing protein n=1 Tax=Eumeta variegata TaxID=151549 RepID=A0A4C1Y3I9_EUMVA|nr:hypothetical protein EVAR_87376_1 [Eumeta japonica]